jgi:hypothetical protein
LKSKREIVTQLVHVHMLALQLFKCEQRHYDKQSAAGDQFYKSLTEKEHDLAKKLDEEREVFEKANTWQDDGTWALPGVFDVPVPMQSVENLTLKDLDLVLTNARPNAFYDHFVVAQRRLFVLSKNALVDVSQGAVDRSGSYLFEGTSIEIENLAQFRSEASDNMEQLIRVLKTVQSLRGSVGKAAEL